MWKSKLNSRPLSHVSYCLLLISYLLLLVSYPVPVVAQANTVNIRVGDVMPRARIFIAPRALEVLEGSTFDVAVLLDTRGNSVNTISLNLKFSPDVVNVVKPSTEGKSFFSIWLEPPTYSNVEGTARFVGVVNNGIKTENGLITRITFKAVKSGQAELLVRSTSEVLANDGLGSPVELEFGKAIFNIKPKPPDGVTVFSETHPFESQWYNNRNVTLAWESNPAITDYSFELNDKPLFAPDDNPDTKETVVSYNNLNDGLWYFHIKARKNGVWGAITNFLVRIDTTPPADFRPKVDFLLASIIERALVSFFTTDNLSGLDHYEVAVIDKGESPLQSSVFVQTESPYQLPRELSDNFRVIVRAVDRASNVRDEALDVNVPFSWWLMVRNNMTLVLVLMALLTIFLLISHYLFGHRILRRLKDAWQRTKNGDDDDDTIGDTTVEVEP